MAIRRAGELCFFGYEACWTGELHVCKWLFGHGAATTIRTKDCYNQTPMYAACFNNHLKVAQWLYAKGAMEDTREVNR